MIPPLQLVTVSQKLLTVELAGWLTHRLTYEALRRPRVGLVCLVSIFIRCNSRRKSHLTDLSITLPMLCTWQGNLTLFF